MPGYYDGLSGESSSSDGSESEQDEHFTADQLLRQPPSRCDRSSHEEDNHRCIVHVDVDCFYCQCEMIDRNLPEDRPLAIGQKHIIVTCNYAARRLGVQKLELRDKAYAKCPSLLILEGSDLTRYRIHARKIYEAFRKACKNIMPSLPVCKGSMDEMMADLTLACQSGTWLDTPPQRDLPIYVYGDQDQEETVLTEDQTGASVTVREKIASRSPDNEHHCQLSAKLRRATTLATQIRESILQETGFRVTCGVSTNPLLSKLASGLRKPGTVNLLYPWRAAQLLENMPIRKLNGVGHQTLKLLRPCLLRHFPGRREPIIWQCR
jgi:DNA polymerase iota